MLKNCPVCGTSPHKTAQAGAATTPLPVPAGPNHRVHVDLYGSLKTSESGNKYTFGVPRQIHSDQGLEFCNQLMTVICDKLNINRTTTTPYHPQCNATAERFNRTMGQYLRKAIHDSESSSLDWELYLGPLMLSYNSGVSKSTRMSPFYATFGFDSRLPLWGFT